MKRVTDAEAREIAAETEKTELTKAERQAAREQRRVEKAEKERRTFREKLIAPIILLLTIGACLILMTLY